jgi:AbrB family looped-hinge helix DNA binding protein
MEEPNISDVRRVRVDSAGRVVIPADLREHLGIEPGQDLILVEGLNGIQLRTFAQAVRSAQEAFGPYRVEGVSVVDELLNDRREEARREYGE